MYDGEKAKYELVSAWLAGHPCPSWDDVMFLLSQLVSEGRGREGAVEEVEEKYLRSELQHKTFSFVFFKCLVVLNPLQTSVTHIDLYTVHVEYIQFITTSSILLLKGHGHYVSAYLRKLN